MSRGSIALLLTIATGCGGGFAGESPRGTIRAYGHALRHGDARAAWSLLDEDARHGRTSPEHARLMGQNRQELARQGRALERAAGGGDVEARARVPLRSGEHVLLVLENGGWRIEGGILDSAGLGTPLDAVGALRRALMRRDLEGVERVLSRQTRAEWEEEVRRIVESTADPDDLEVEVQGNRAQVRTTGGGSIELVRESGEWRVVDVHPP